MLLNKKIKRGVQMSDAFDSFEDDNGLTHIDGLNMLYTFLFNKHYRAEKLYFLLDGLDEQLRGKMNEDQQKYLLDLLAAVTESCWRMYLLTARLSTALKDAKSTLDMTLRRSGS